MDQETRAQIDGYRPLDPNHLKVLRARGALSGLLLLVLAAVPAFAIGGLAGAAIGVGALLLALVSAFVVPTRSYRRTLYRETEDELFIDTGVLVRLRTVVPFGRVQHSDVAQGPLQRRYGVATLTLHTAGTVGGSVDLPGLKAEEAEALRDRVRAKIRRELA